MRIDQSELVWLNGNLVPRSDATVSILSPTSQYGINVFEGMRCYVAASQDRMYGFRLHDHWLRLTRSAMLLGIDFTWNYESMLEALRTLIAANNYAEDITVRLVVYVEGTGNWASSGPSGVLLSAVRQGRLHKKGTEGVSCCISSWNRISDNTVSPRIKAGANYINSRMAMLEARDRGFDSALLLNVRGTLAEGPGACVFIVADGVLITPSVTSSILESITRDSVLELAVGMGLPVEEREIERTEVYGASEAFFCGTSVELLPITRIDRFTLSAGKAGPITLELLDHYLKSARGSISTLHHWNTEVRDGMSPPQAR